jgi:hypothetical protein
MQEYRWVVELDGRKHSIRASVSAAKMVSVYLDDNLVHDKPMPAWWNNIVYRFGISGHDVKLSRNAFGSLLLWVGWRRIPAIGWSNHDQPAVEDTGVPPSCDPPRFELVETQRIEETLGEDRRVIDNSNSSVQVQRKIVVSREWAQTIAIDHETTTTAKGDTGVKLPFAVEVKLEAERRIREKYSTATETKKKYSEEVVITVPAKTKIELVFAWKQVWQCGIVRLHAHDGSTSELPYRLCLEPTFDQRQVESPA